MNNLSRPIEALMAERREGDIILRADVVVVGSGYGGAVAAMKLAGKDRAVVVLERGLEYRLGDFPYDVADMPAHVRFAGAGRGYADALFNLYGGKQVDVLVGSGLGGTSLINANVAESPSDHVFKKPGWPHQFRNGPKPLKDAFSQVRRFLGVTQHGSESLPKYNALSRLGESIEATANKADITVTMHAGENAVGVSQAKCTDCGNCVTGCNVGAKNSLDRNFIPLAKSRGASFYTGANVLTVEPSKEDNYRWKITVSPTKQSGDRIRQEQYAILANTVILAAGTLGSTEILHRSQRAGSLSLSKQLGKRFSTNGDGLIMSYGQSEVVNAIAQSEQACPKDDGQIGPTITGIIKAKVKVSTGQVNHFTIEDASIPAAIAGLYREALVTGAQFQRLANRKLPQYIKSSNIDPLAANREAARHSQALLIMGDDGASGTMEPRLDERGEVVGLELDFPGAERNGALIGANDLVRSQDRAAGLDGGQYVPNPLWELFPPQAGDAMSGALPGGRVITVHPLGGCAMGDSVDSGVVNHLGNVFQFDKDKPGSSQTYEGLYVLDGAIVPTALEINPLLTIAALAWRSADGILERLGQTESSQDRASKAYTLIDAVPGRPQRDTPVEIEINEQLVGYMDSVPPGVHMLLNSHEHARLTQPEGLIVIVKAQIPNGDTWLDNPGDQDMPAQMLLYVNPLSAEQVSIRNPAGLKKVDLKNQQPFMTLPGKFTMLREDRICVIKDYWRGFKALRTYKKRRGGGLSLFKSLMQYGWSGSKVFINLAVLQGRKRRMIYAFKSSDSALTIKGKKVISYDRGLPGRLWPTLVNIDLVIKEPRRAGIRARVSVNAKYLVESGVLQMKQMPNLPQGLAFSLGAGGYFARSLLATNFWEFAGLDYPAQPVVQHTLPGKLKTRTGLIEPEFETLLSPVKSGSDGVVPMLMTRYRQTDANAKPILLLHGLAQGSQIFWLNALEQNLARYLFDQGFDVWMLDYRLSNHIMPSLPNSDWTMDEIAEFDIPIAVDHVYQATGQALSIYAHCVGACSFAMAVLDGKIDADKISAVVSNAIHPWVITSPANQVRAKLGGLYRDWVQTENLNPIPGPDDGAFQNVLDRMAYSFSKLGEQDCDDHVTFGGDATAQGICDRMSLLYGRMWNHKNLNRATHDAFVHLLGPAPTKVYQHLYYYSLRQRITNHSGGNQYLRSELIRANWRFPILFIHGADSRVFNPYSARKSAEQLGAILRDEGTSAAVQYKIYPSYGHMDVIFGKQAHQDCFPDAVSFLRDPNGFNGDELDSKPLIQLPSTPEIGPVLRAAWVEDSVIKVRYWAKLQRHHAITPMSLGLVDGNGEQLIEAGITVPSADKATNDPGLQAYRYLDVKILEPLDQVSLRVEARMPGVLAESGEPNLTYNNESWMIGMRRRLAGEPSQHMSFLVGSCRFPGTVIDRALSDNIYQVMSQHICGPEGAELLFLLGDQIYADGTDELLEVADPMAKYGYRYRRAFDAQYSPNYAALLRSLPVHFALDDHELTDEWSGLHKPENPDSVEKKAMKSGRDERDIALSYATRFQGSTRNQTAIGAEAYASPFYYALNHSAEIAFPSFMMDTRTEREFRSDSHDTTVRLVSDVQFAALRDWLLAAHLDHPTKPKFIFSGSVMGLMPQKNIEQRHLWRQLDGWAGYPATLERLLKIIAQHKIYGVVFVGGNEHFSIASTIDLAYKGSRARAYQVVSSGLYSPLPFANSQPKDYVWGQPVSYPVLIDENLSYQVTAHLLSDQQSQFMKLDVDSRQIKIRCIDGNNQSLAMLKIDLMSETMMFEDTLEPALVAETIN